MGRIQSNVGLVTGIPITQTVDQLMAVAARPRARLEARTALLTNERVAITELTALVLGMKNTASRLADIRVFNGQKATSQNPSLVAATITGTPVPGTFQLTPARLAQVDQWLSSGFASADEPIGAGSFTFGYGGFLDPSVQLDQLNGGAGVARGKIRITDRSGAAAVIDLGSAQTIGDVLDKINADDTVRVRAVVQGDTIRLIDETGVTTSNLKVQEVGFGSTAADLGLNGIDVNANQATGQDVLRLYSGLQLDDLNDGNGIGIRGSLDDLEVAFRDGSQLTIDFHPLVAPSTSASATTQAQNGVNAQVTVTAVQTGASFDNVAIRFIDSGSVTQGTETVQYDDAGPNNKTLTFDIDAGFTTAADIVTAITNNPTVSALFTASAGGTGNGLVSLSDSGVTSGGAPGEPRTERTLGELLSTINAADPARLRAEIASDGERLVLTDLTVGGGSFAVASSAGGNVAETLGIAGSTAGSTITGRRLLGGLGTSLAASLAGGQGLPLGQLQLTDRSGASDTVDLSSAETFDEILDAINGAAVGITASINSARNGIALTDTTGGGGALIVANGDVTNTADKLGIAFNGASSSVNGTSVNRQTVSRSTQLKEFNGGKGVTLGSIRVTDSSGATSAVSLKLLNAETVGDVIDAVNDLGIGVNARINDTGDGILLTDTAGGPLTLKVTDVSGTSAADLRIAGDGKSVSVPGSSEQIINGATRVQVQFDGDDSLQDIVAEINSLQPDVRASVVRVGGSANPYRLSLVGGVSGSKGQLLIDTRSAGFDLEQLSRAQDALVGYGATGSGELIASATNKFDDLIEGVELTLKGVSDQPVAIDIATSHDDFIASLDTLVKQYNSLRTRIDDLTFFKETDNSTGILFGSNEVLRIESQLGGLLTGVFSGVGDVRTLAEIGLNLDDKGKLSLDKDELSDRLATDPEAVEELFTDSSFGVGKKLSDMIDRLSGDSNSLLNARSEALQDSIEDFQARITFMNDRLDQQRERMLNQFYALDLIVGKLRNDLSIVNSISGLPPVTTGSSRLG